LISFSNDVSISCGEDIDSLFDRPKGNYAYQKCNDLTSHGYDLISNIALLAEIRIKFNKKPANFELAGKSTKI
jgi:hypothetical protein